VDQEKNSVDHPDVAQVQEGQPRYFGSITQAGMSSGTVGVMYWVRFESDNPKNSFFGTWPEWAYELAKEACLYNRPVMVLTNGSEPQGNNIVQVLIRTTPA
jgi:hypothetical protein